jgi:ACT domain-containing protein
MIKRRKMFMKIKELVELANNNKNKMLKTDQLQQVIAKAIEVKKYLNIKEKRALIEDIVNSCILYEDGMYKFDDINKYVVFTMKTIAAYTNIELSTDIEDDYDDLCIANLLNVVIETFAGEYENVNILLQMRCEYILSGNTIEAQFGKFLTGITDRIDDFTDVLKNKVEDFDFSNLPISMDDFGKLIEFVNSFKK